MNRPQKRCLDTRECEGEAGGAGEGGGVDDAGVEGGDLGGDGDELVADGVAVRGERSIGTQSVTIPTIPSELSEKGGAGEKRRRGYMSCWES